MLSRTVFAAISDGICRLAAAIIRVDLLETGGLRIGTLAAKWNLLLIDWSD